MATLGYLDLMGEAPPHVILNLDTREPIELGDFVGAFVALGNDYERFLSERGVPDPTEAKIFVKEVRRGSIEAELIPWLSLCAPFIADIEKILLVEDFVRRWGGRLQTLLSGSTSQLPETTGELRDWARMVEAVANDPDGKATISAAFFENGEKKIRASVQFDTREARQAVALIEQRRREIERTPALPHERVLMVFTRSDVNDANLHKRSGERVKIEALQERPLALIYGSQMAEERIKHEIREADDNIYKKGFVVDVIVQMRNGKPVAYSVTDVHQVVDLED